MTTTTCNAPDPGLPGSEGPSSPGPSNGKRSRVVVLATATVLVAAGLVLFLYLRSRPDHPLPESSTAASAVLELDLGGPPAERISIPVLSPPAGLQDVMLAFMVPVSPGALYEVEVQGPDDEPLLSSERGPLPLDDLGGARVSVPSSRFEKSGTYRLVLREFASDGAIREYRYSFRVYLPAAG